MTHGNTTGLVIAANNIVTQTYTGEENDTWEHYGSTYSCKQNSDTNVYRYRREIDTWEHYGSSHNFNKNSDGNGNGHGREIGTWKHYLKRITF